MASQILSSKDRAIRLISRIQSAHIRQIRQRRENNRQNISLPCQICPAGVATKIEALTRDLSSEGIGLITSQPIDLPTEAEIELSISGCTESIFAKCCWCEQSGSFHLSGWKFISDPANA